MSVSEDGLSPVSCSVCAEAQSLCSILSEAAAAGLALDLSPELTRAVTNVVCSLCFNSSYRRGDPEFEAMLRYSQGIVDTVAKDSLVDIFPWLQVDNMNTEEKHLSRILMWEMRQQTRRHMKIQIQTYRQRYTGTQFKVHYEYF